MPWSNKPDIIDIFIDNFRKQFLPKNKLHLIIYDISDNNYIINKWNKEEDDNKLRDAISMVTRQSMKTLGEWKETNPDYKDGNSDFSNQCISMQMNSAAGMNRDVYYQKVITALAKETIVDKSII
jgi:hypothetical protein